MLNHLFDPQELSKSWCCLRTLADSSRSVDKVCPSFLSILNPLLSCPRSTQTGRVTSVTRGYFLSREKNREFLRLARRTRTVLTCWTMSPVGISIQMFLVRGGIRFSNHFNLTCRPFLCLGGGSHHPDI